MYWLLYVILLCTCALLSNNNSLKQKCDFYNQNKSRSRTRIWYTAVYIYQWFSRLLAVTHNGVMPGNRTKYVVLYYCASLLVYYNVICTHYAAARDIPNPAIYGLWWRQTIESSQKLNNRKPAPVRRMFNSSDVWKFKAIFKSVEIKRGLRGENVPNIRFIVFRLNTA